VRAAAVGTARGVGGHQAQHQVVGRHLAARNGLRGAAGGREPFEQRQVRQRRQAAQGQQAPVAAQPGGQSETRHAGGAARRRYRIGLGAGMVFLHERRLMRQDFTPSAAQAGAGIRQPYAAVRG